MTSSAPTVMLMHPHRRDGRSRVRAEQLRLLAVATLSLKPVARKATDPNPKR